jgi:hypothetical protein
VSSELLESSKAGVEDYLGENRHEARVRRRVEVGETFE